jgi:hypothetical protein
LRQHSLIAPEQQRFGLGVFLFSSEPGTEQALATMYRVAWQLGRPRPGGLEAVGASAEALG